MLNTDMYGKMKPSVKKIKCLNTFRLDLNDYIMVGMVLVIVAALLTNGLLLHKKVGMKQQFYGNAVSVE